jgi:3-hydroxyisobutyrate dehydrogenase-like beta-hydroxyacid dehydrogenase
MEAWLMTDSVVFMGLVNLGGSMARYLIKGGFPLTVFDMRAVVLREFEALGGRVAASPRVVGAVVDLLLVMVMSYPQTREVLFGDNGAVHDMRAGAIVGCMNTIAPSEISAIGEEVRERGLRTLDAPVSGGSHNAAAGTLTIMVGADPDVLADARGALDAIGKQIFHVGGVGKGQILKMMNQLLVSVEMVSIAEALVLGAKAGIDGDTLYEVVRATSGDSGMFRAKVPKIIAGDFSSTGDLDIHVKDLEIVTRAAHELGVPVMLTSLAHEVFRTAQVAGKGKLDACAVITLLVELTGARPRMRGLEDQSGANP